MTSSVVLPGWDEAPEATSRRGVTLTDWNAHLETAQQRIAEIEGKISVQKEAMQRLSAQGADTGIVARMLQVLNDSLERANIHKRFIESRMDLWPSSAQQRG
jgi:hypothetical protein